MHVVDEGVEPSEIVGEGTLELANALDPVADEEEMMRETIELQKEIEKVDANEQAQHDSKQDQARKIEQLKNELMAELSESSSSDDDDDTAIKVESTNVNLNVDLSTDDDGENDAGGTENVTDDGADVAGTPEAVDEIDELLRHQPPNESDAGEEDEAPETGQQSSTRASLTKPLKSSSSGSESNSDTDSETGDDDDDDQDRADIDDDGDGNAKNIEKSSLAHSVSRPPAIDSRKSLPRKASSPRRTGASRGASTVFSVPASVLGISPPTRRRVIAIDGSGGGSSVETSVRRPIIDMTESVVVAPPPPPPQPLPDVLTVELKARLVWMMEEVAEVQELLKEFHQIQCAVQAHHQQHLSTRESHSRSSHSLDSSRSHSRASSTTSLASPSLHPFSQALAAAHANKLERVDTAMVKWHNIMRMNPFLYQFVGVDFPTESPRILSLAELRGINFGVKLSSSPTNELEPLRRASLEIQANGALGPGDAVETAVKGPDSSPAYSRQGSLDDQPKANRIGSTSQISLPSSRQPSRPSSGRVGREPIETDSSEQLSDSTALRRVATNIKRPMIRRELLPHERIDPPDRTITAQSWIEAFQRLAREPTCGLQAVRHIIDEFNRIAKVVKEEVRLARIEQQRLEEDVAQSRPFRSSFFGGANKSLQSTGSSNRLVGVDLDLSEVDTRMMGMGIGMTDFTNGSLMDESNGNGNPSVSISATHRPMPMSDAPSSIFSFLPHLDPTVAPSSHSLSEGGATVGMRALGMTTEESNTNLRPTIRWRGTPNQ